MRELGWYADSWPELSMNVGTWMMFLSVGWIAGWVYGFTPTLYVIGAIGILLGVSGQLTWVKYRNA